MGTQPPGGGQGGGVIVAMGVGLNRGVKVRVNVGPPGNALTRVRIGSPVKARNVGEKMGAWATALPRSINDRDRLPSRRAMKSSAIKKPINTWRVSLIPGPHSHSGLALQGGQVGEH